MNEREISLEKLSAAKSILRNLDGANFKVDVSFSTAEGDWFPLAEEVDAPIVGLGPGKRYALTLPGKSRRIAWSQLHQHLVSAAVTQQHLGILYLQFDEILSKQMDLFSRTNHDHTLAIVSCNHSRTSSLNGC